MYIHYVSVSTHTFWDSSLQWVWYRGFGVCIFFFFNAGLSTFWSALALILWLYELSFIVNWKFPTIIDWFQILPASSRHAAGCFYWHNKELAVSDREAERSLCRSRKPQIHAMQPGFMTISLFLLILRWQLVLKRALRPSPATVLSGSTITLHWLSLEALFQGNF